MGKSIYPLLFMIMSCIIAHADECRRDTLHVTLNFPLGKSAVDTAFSSNADGVRVLVSQLDGLDVDSILVKGGASPEGPLPLNNRLAAARARNGADFISRFLSVPDDNIILLNGGIDWQRLRGMIDTCGEEWKYDAMRIIDNVPELVYKDGKVVDGRNRQLGLLDGGKAWRYMSRHFFSSLRNADLSITVSRKGEPDGGSREERVPVYLGSEAEQAVTGDSCSRERVPVYLSPDIDETTVAGDAASSSGDAENSLPASDTGRKVPWIAVKTNLLYDVVAVPHFGFEIGLGPDYSLGANGVWAWWSRNTSHRYWRVYGGEVELRRWFTHRNDRSVTHSGHHVGLYGQMASYDIEFGGRGWQSDGLSYGIGVSYGYSLSLSRYFNLDFTIGLGYFGGSYKKYVPMDGCYVWQATVNRNWIGPTKAEISLVWILSGRRKGGKQ